MFFCSNCHKTYKTTNTFDKHKCVKTGIIPKWVKPITIYRHFSDFSLNIQKRIVQYWSMNEFLKGLEIGLPIYSIEQESHWKSFWTNKICTLVEKNDKIEDSISVKNYIYYICNVCFECGMSTSNVDHFYNYHICSSCRREIPKYKLITKTTCKKEFCLSEKDLTGLDHVLSTNPYYRSSAPMMLFLESDIKEYAYDKYGGVDGLQNKLKKRQESLEKRRQTKKNVRENRKFEIQQELAMRGMNVRNDSKLCQGYINNTLDSRWTLEKVVDMMIEMKWLYEYTDYQQELDKQMNSYARHNHIPIYATYSYVEDDVRRHVLAKNPVPHELPWIG
jgi:DNA repair protein